MDGRTVGEITSAGYSRVLGRIVALGYAKSQQPDAPLSVAALRNARFAVDIAGTLACVAAQPA
jgi:glycine cleavage system aminomethyltransferase T